MRSGNVTPLTFEPEEFSLAGLLGDNNLRLNDVAVAVEAPGSPTHGVGGYKRVVERVKRPVRDIEFRQARATEFEHSVMGVFGRAADCIHVPAHSALRTIRL